MDLKTNFLSTNTWYFRIKKKDKGTDDVLRWKSKAVYNSKLKPLYTAFLHSIKRSGYKVGKNLINIL